MWASRKAVEPHNAVHPTGSGERQPDITHGRLAGG